MNKLFATWHSADDVDVTDQPELDVAEMLARVHDDLAEIPELGHARHLVEIALDDVLAWFDGAVALRVVRSTSSAGTR
jgi:hypothetical protein